MLESLIPKLMEIKGWNTTKLMLECGISWGSASSIAHGKIPGPITLDKCCEAFECQPGDLIMWKEE